MYFSRHLTTGDVLQNDFKTNIENATIQKTDVTGCILFVFDGGFEKTFSSAQAINAKIKAAAIVPAGVVAYAL